MEWEHGLELEFCGLEKTSCSLTASLCLLPLSGSVCLLESCHSIRCQPFMFTSSLDQKWLGFLLGLFWWLMGRGTPVNEGRGRRLSFYSPSLIHSFSHPLLCPRKFVTNSILWLASTLGLTRYTHIPCPSTGPHTSMSLWSPHGHSYSTNSYSRNYW